MRYLTSKLLDLKVRNNPVYIVINDSTGIVESVERFERELADTSYIGYPVALIQASAVTDFLLDDLDMILSHGGNDITARIDTMLRASGLYPDKSTPAIALVLSPAGVRALTQPVS